MTYEWIELETTPGASFVQSDEIKFRRLLDVNRDGMGFDLIYSGSLADNRTALHQTYHGILKFKVPFTTGEKVNVLIKNQSTI